MRLQERPASSVRFKMPAISATPRSLLAVLLSIACVVPLGTDWTALAATPPAAAKDKKQKQDPSLKGLPITELSADEAILHALNRLTYGPRPGDLERVRQLGLAKWIDQQLNPNSIDDRALEARLENYPTLRMSTAKLISEYPQPKPAEKQAEKQAQKEAQLRAQIAPGELSRSDAAAATVARDMQADRKQLVAADGEAAQPQESAQTKPDMPKPEINDAPSPMKQPEPGDPATKGAGKRDALGGGDPNNVPRAVADDSKRPQRVVAELAMAKVTRAIYSERQLQQVMDDFWFNHFNVFAGKGEDRYYLTSYERDVIQPHTFGKFKDLLTATAKSPAMLFYLDNFLSADPRAAQRQAMQRAVRQQMRYGRLGGPWPPRPPVNPQNAKKNERGLNENYGRELMELHTLGVDGGYTQKDVTEVARSFTGWTIDKPRVYADFKFDEKFHDPDPKYVLGKKIHAGGMKDGEQVIDMLVHYPSTAKFISTKLARRFVSDNPPPALIERMAQTFQSSDGDIRTVMKIDKPRVYADFKFDEKLHDPDPKYVLGKKIHSGGMKDGEQVIDMLVHYPSTAKFISTKLARRFVSDNPPPALIERMAQTFQSSDGDIRAVMKTMIWSPEFWSREAYRAKIKTPFELVVSTARALGTDVDTPLPLVQWVGRIGEPLYQCQPPTGYSDKAETWVNTGALLNRLNYSLALAGNKLRGSRTDVASLLGADSAAEPKAALDRAVQVFLGGQAARSTVETLEQQLENPQIVQAKLDDQRKQADLGVVAGLVLGAPEFQRR